MLKKRSLVGRASKKVGLNTVSQAKDSAEIFMCLQNHLFLLPSGSEVTLLKRKQIQCVSVLHSTGALFVWLRLHGHSE